MLWNPNTPMYEGFASHLFGWTRKYFEVIARPLFGLRVENITSILFKRDEGNCFPSPLGTRESLVQGLGLKEKCAGQRDFLFEKCPIQTKKTLFGWKIKSFSIQFACGKHAPTENIPHTKLLKKLHMRKLISFPRLFPRNWRYKKRALINQKAGRREIEREREREHLIVDRSSAGSESKSDWRVSRGRLESPGVVRNPP